MTLLIQKPVILTHQSLLAQLKTPGCHQRVRYREKKKDGIDQFQTEAKEGGGAELKNKERVYLTQAMKNSQNCLARPENVSRPQRSRYEEINNVQLTLHEWR